MNFIGNVFFFLKKYQSTNELFHRFNKNCEIIYNIIFMLKCLPLKYEFSNWRYLAFKVKRHFFNGKYYKLLIIII